MLYLVVLVSDLELEIVQLVLMDIIYMENNVFHYAPKDIIVQIQQIFHKLATGFVNLVIVLAVLVLDHRIMNVHLVMEHNF